MAHHTSHLDMPSSTDSAITLQGIRNQQSTSRQCRLPITKSILHALIAALPFAVTNQYQLALWKALFLLTFHGCMRAGEVTLANNRQNLIQTSQVQLAQDAVCISFRAYKHSQGATPTITISADPSPATCPVSSLRNYLAYRGSTPGPLFIHQNSSAVTRQQFSEKLKATSTICNLPSHSYNTHSFRVGRATQMATDGQSDQTIRTAGRWKSSTFQRYIRPTNFVLPH